MSLPSVSRHLKVLEQAGLVVKGRSAQWRAVPTSTHAPLAEADAWMAPYRQLLRAAARAASRSSWQTNGKRRSHDEHRS